MDQPRPLFIVIGLVALIAMAAGVYVAIEAESSVTHEQAAPPAAPPAG
jgi:hypothetical protein